MEGGLINPLALIRTGAAEGVTSGALPGLGRFFMESKSYPAACLSSNQPGAPSQKAAPFRPP